AAAAVIAACPDTPSLVAVTTTCPATTPATKPLPDTVAVAVFALAHVTTRPVSTFPLASRVTTLSCTVCPTTTLAVAGDTVTVATGAGGGGTVTVTTAWPVRPSLVAVIVAVPADRPVTSPALDTVATPAFDVAHVITRPVNTAPPASRVVA